MASWIDRKDSKIIDLHKKKTKFCAEKHFFCQCFRNPKPQNVQTADVLKTETEETKFRLEVGIGFGKKPLDIFGNSL
ncbi:MAG: hypothetical protein IKA76_05120 [Clostridia bacterium]|nr:hypothetical protein [Clostridia bacterium]